MTTTPRFSCLFLLLSACSTDDAKTDAKDAPDASQDLDAEAPEPATCSGKTGAAGISNLDFAYAGGPDAGVRTAIVHVPPGYDATKPTMLVLNMHGLVETNTLQEQVSHMSEVADERGFIVVYPSGTTGLAGLSWNAGDCCVNPADDVGYLRELVTRLKDDYCIDPKRVFATGLSNGAMMSYRLACEAADVFAAVAPVAGAVMTPCTPSRPVPILAIHGTGDTIVPFNGGLDGIFHVLNFPPLSYSMDLWRSLDGCSGATEPDGGSKKPMPDLSTFDGGPDPSVFEGSTPTFEQGDSECHTWSECKEGSEVQLCTVVNGGHTWPGGLPLIGKTTMNLDSTAAIIDFFEKHPMK